MGIAFYTPTSIRRIGFGVAILASAFVILVAPGKANAATSYSITMTPSSTELHGLPGATVPSTFTVVNQGLTDYPIALSIAPYHVIGDSYDPQFTPLAGTTDASSWVHFLSPATETLTAGHTQTIAYNVSIPAGTVPGGYYAVIFAETTPTSTGNGVTAHNRVGDILYITVDGQITKKGTLRAPSPDLPSIIWGNSVAVGTLVSDTGGVHFLSTVKINATSLFGRSLFTANLQRYVLPQTQRLVTTTWAHLPIVGIYQISRSATVAGATQTLPVKDVLIIRPWFLAILVIVIAAAISLAVLARRRNNGGESDVKQ